MATEAKEREGEGAEMDVLMKTEKTFPPPEEFAEQANANDPKIYDEANADPEKWWASWADKLEWIEPYETVLDWSDPPHAKWFAEGKLNASVNCLDRHVDAGNGDRVAFHWEGEDGVRKDVTYAELLDSTQRFANVLKGLGVGKGDVVGIYLPMIPETPAAMLACARIGAVHNVVFGGFSATSVKERMEFSDAKCLVTADATMRRGEPTPMKKAVDEMLGDLPSMEHVVVVNRGDTDPPMTEGRDVFWHEAVDEADPECEPEPMSAEDPLFILYTSGSTGKPKGILHTTAGYLTQTSATHKLVFDLKDDDVYWCGADVGWVTGHSYIVYGPMVNGATSVMYEGAPNYPAEDRWWEIIERYKVSIFYTAPTAIRACMKWGREHPDGHDLSSLRLLGTVGEPINPRAWLWYHEVIGGERCPIVDTWWQTETGGIMIAPLPGLTTTKPGSATVPFPGIEAKIYTESGEEVDEGAGILVLTRPWPVDGAHPLQGGRPLRRDLLGPLRPRHLPGRRRRPGRRGRLLLDRRPDRRRDQRLGPPALDDGGRVDARLEPEGRRGRGGRRARRDDGPGDRRLRASPRGATATASRTSCAPTSPTRSASSPARSRSSSATTCRRRAQARSCAASCARSARARTTWAT